MRIPFLLFATVLLGSSAWAQDEDSPYYIEFGVGGVFSSEAEVFDDKFEFDPGYSLIAAVGREWELGDRLNFEGELEALYQAFSIDEDDLPVNTPDDAKTFALMLNGVLDYEFTQQYSIYGGLGVGWAKEIEYDTFDSGGAQTDDDDGLAYQGLFGFAYNLGGDYDLRLGYRYFRTEPVDVQAGSESSEIDVGQHSLEAVLRWGL